MIHFIEVQRFASNWIAKVGGVAVVVALVGTIVGGVHGADLVGLLIALAVFMAVGFLLLFGKLETEVRDDALYVRLFPLTKRHRFAFASIAECAARDYRPIREYGGWGIRFSLRHGKAYNVSGTRGVQLVFADGKRLLLGSQQSDALAAAIREAAHAAGVSL